MHVYRPCLCVNATGGTEVFVKITREEEEIRWFEMGAYVANIGRKIDLRAIKKRREDGK